MQFETIVLAFNFNVVDDVYVKESCLLTQWFSFCI